MSNKLFAALCFSSAMFIAWVVTAPAPATPAVPTPAVTPAPLPGCEFEWAGPVTRWVLVDDRCAGNCSAPTQNGTFIGQVKVVPCSACE